MNVWVRSMLLAGVVVLSASPAHAKKERCKAYVEREWELIAKTYTDGGCSLEAKKRIAPKVCTAGVKKFEFRYMFDGDIKSGQGWCRNN